MSQKQLDFLKGAWDLLEATFTARDGSIRMPWGPSPIGMGLITESGDFSAHVMRARRARFASDHPTPAEKQQAYDDYFSYFGRILRLDDAEGAMISRVGGSSNPNFVPRPSFSLELKWSAGCAGSAGAAILLDLSVTLTAACRRPQLTGVLDGHG